MSPVRKWVWQCSLLCLAVMWMAATLAATSAAALSGSWRAVEERTYWSDDALPKGFSLTLNLTFSENRFEYRSINDTDKSKPPQGFQFATSLDGALQPMLDQKPNGFDHISFKQTAAREFRLLRFLDGELVAAQFWTFSADGREMARRGATRTDKGPWHAYEEWFVRQ